MKTRRPRGEGRRQAFDGTSRRPSACGLVTAAVIASLYGPSTPPLRIEQLRLTLRVDAPEPVECETWLRCQPGISWAPCGGGWRRLKASQ